MGDVAIDDSGKDPENIDRMQILYDPLDSDTCFDDRGHGGTRDLIRVLSELLNELVNTEFSLTEYKANKNYSSGENF